MDSVVSVKDSIKSLIKATIRTIVFFVAILFLLFSGMLLGQLEMPDGFENDEITAGSSVKKDRLMVLDLSRSCAEKRFLVRAAGSNPSFPS